MERETLDFSGWLRSVEAATENLGLADSLNALAMRARTDFGVSLWFVEIVGRRWSYIAGQMPDQPPPSCIERIELEQNIGLVSDSWEKLSEDDRRKIVASLKQLVSQKSTRERAVL